MTITPGCDARHSRAFGKCVLMVTTLRCDLRIPSERVNWREGDRVLSRIIFFGDCALT
jgi:hypothetical protein